MTIFQLLQLRKMVKINDTGGRVDNKNENKYKRTLNGSKRQHELDRIERENIAVLRRLGKIKNHKKD